MSIFWYINIEVMKMTYTYTPEGVCSMQMIFEIEKDNIYATDRLVWVELR